MSESRRPAPPEPTRAMAHLCELVRRHNARSFQRVVDFDWGPYPRLLEAGLDRLDPASPELARQACRAALQRAVEELEPRHPDPEDDVSPITVLRQHVLEGETWDVILAERDERGRTRLSERTLKNRQREGCRLILDWAAGGEGVAPAPADPHPRGRRLLVLGAGVVGALLLILVGATFFAGSRPDRLQRLERQLRNLPQSYIGVPLALPHMPDPGQPDLQALVPDLQLPDLGGTIQRALFLPGPEGGPPRLLVATYMQADPPGRVALYDALAESLLWTTDWSPPREEVRTHATLTEPDLLEQDWAPFYMVWSDGQENLGDRVLVIYGQLYSPVFAVFLDRRTGQELSRYAHPGHLNYALVRDVTGDGRTDAVLLGTNNVQDRPTYVVLDPRRDGPGAASSVLWNEGGEAALFRVVLPDMPSFRQDPPASRLAALPLREHLWNVGNQTLTVPVGGYDDGGRTVVAYESCLRHGWQVLGGGRSIQMDETTANRWGERGLDVEETRRRLEGEIQVIRGTGFQKALGGDIASRLQEVDPGDVGVALGGGEMVDEGQASLEEILPGLPLPDLDTPLKTTLLLPDPDGGPPKVLLGTSFGGRHGGRLLLWDAVGREVLWSLDWRPPAEEILTHPGVPPIALDEPWQVRDAVYRTGPWDLGDRLCVVYTQRWSPTFLLFVDRRTGEPLFHYAHPGNLLRPRVYDLCGNGVNEVVVAGTDNELDQAVVVALDPWADEDGAASTVQWNRQGEGALFRVVFPDLPAWMRAEGVTRQHASNLRLRDWNPESRVLLVHVGTGHRSRSGYMAYLHDGWEVLPGRTLAVSDAIENQWKRLGLDQAATLAELEAGIEVIRGRGFGSILAGDGPPASPTVPARR